MVAIFNFLLHIVIVAGFIGLVFVSAKLAWFYQSPSEFERSIRVLSCVVGFLIYIGSRAVGLSMPELMMSAIAQGSFVNTFVLAILLPAGVGVAVTWFIINRLQHSHAIALRSLLMLIVFVLFLLVDSYAVAFGESVNGENINKFLLPNMIFTLSVSLYAIFFLKPESLPVSTYRFSRR